MPLEMRKMEEMKRKCLDALTRVHAKSSERFNFLSIIERLKQRKLIQLKTTNVVLTRRPALASRVATPAVSSSASSSPGPVVGPYTILDLSTSASVS